MLEYQYFSLDKGIVNAIRSDLSSIDSVSVSLVTTSSKISLLNFKVDVKNRKYAGFLLTDDEYQTLVSRNSLSSFDEGDLSTIHIINSIDDARVLFSEELGVDIYRSLSSRGSGGVGSSSVDSSDSAGGVDDTKQAKTDSYRGSSNSEGEGSSISSEESSHVSSSQGGSSQGDSSLGGSSQDISSQEGSSAVSDGVSTGVPMGMATGVPMGMATGVSAGMATGVSTGMVAKPYDVSENTALELRRLAPYDVSENTALGSVGNIEEHATVEGLMSEADSSSEDSFEFSGITQEIFEAMVIIYNLVGEYLEYNTIEELDALLNGVGTDVSESSMVEAYRVLKESYDSVVNQLQDRSKTSEILKSHIQTLEDKCAELERNNRSLRDSRDNLQDKYDIVLAEKEKLTLDGESFRRDTSMLSVPKMVEFYATSSSFSVGNSYAYLLRARENAVIVDLSTNSILDGLVKMVSVGRVTKWVLEGYNIASIYTRYEAYADIPVADGVSLISSPSRILSDDILSRIEWSVRLGDLAKLNRPVLVYLGLSSDNGVSDLINRLNKPVNILRDTNDVFDYRAYKRLEEIHQGSVVGVDL